MFKKIVLTLILLGFAWAWEPTRVRMILAARPVLERMGPFGERAITPIVRYNTKTELTFIADQIQMAKTEGKETPDANSFQMWMQKHIKTKNHGKDPWDQKYFLIQLGSTLTVGSVGEDGERGTDDDIKASIPF